MSEIQGKKLDQNKPRMSLASKRRFKRCNSSFRVWCYKVSSRQLEDVPDAKTRYYDARTPHIDAWWQGEQKDPETGEHHLAHAICCGMFLWWFDNQQSGVPEAILEAERSNRLKKAPIFFCSPIIGTKEMKFSTLPLEIFSCDIPAPCARNNIGVH